MALMGPSGSGKTTLLNVLAQRYPTSVKGRVCINGSEQPLSIHRTVGAYVEQDDTLIGSMSTKETLKFAADLTISKQVINTSSIPHTNEQPSDPHPNKQSTLESTASSMTSVLQISQILLSARHFAKDSVEVKNVE